MGMRRLVLALLLLCSYSAGRADSLPAQAVYVDLCVAEQDVNRVLKHLHEPVMEVLRALPGIDSVTGASTHGMAQFQIVFKDGASRQDQASVEEALNRVGFTPDVEILSVRVELAQPRNDGLFVGRIAYTEHLRRRR
ncbi:hypothetical protein LK542_01460 [Massilia sp. IC2-477]|uniref:hypothetical protein n=1 Tax=Massilia sp. IC2-477 TaxID=2887198 RepID=UPI001D0F9943|nr:hypothetical protein [Massilia sp. IC2-477]MCC2954277.1 hypothetical protein [Massilia sp. IC2-477]